MTSDPLSGLTAPTLADIEQVAQAAVERLPDQFRRHLATVILKSMNAVYQADAAVPRGHRP